VKKFDRLFTFAHGAFNFLTAGLVGSTASREAPGITRGFNYRNDKAHNLIKIAKQLIVVKYYQLQDLQLDDIAKEIGSCYQHGSLEPLPVSIIHKVPGNTPLFPDCYDEVFLNRLHGVGLKIRRFLAEAGYQQLVVGCFTSPDLPAYGY
jgi:hypothetical protein